MLYQAKKCADRECGEGADQVAARTYRLPSGRTATIQIPVCGKHKAKADARLEMMVRKFERKDTE